MALRILVALVLAYALGCLTTGYYLVRWRKGFDIRTTGSLRVGAWNVLRTLGQGGFWATFCGDGLKAVAAVLVARWLGVPLWAQAVALVLVVVGHNFPAQLGFRGGNGLASATVGLIALDPWLGLGLVALTVVLFPALWPLRRLGVPIFFHTPSQFAVLAAPLVALIAGRDPAVVVALVALVLLVLGSVRTNLRALGEYDMLLNRGVART